MTDSEFSQQIGRLVGQPAIDFVLHREPALMVDRLIDIDIESAICEWHAKSNNVFHVQARGVPVYVGIECMAQCIAVHAGACESVHGFPPPIGLLLGTRLYQYEQQYFETGITYRVECKQLIRNSEGMGSFECCISLSNHVIVKARLSVMQMPRGTTINGR